MAASMQGKTVIVTGAAGGLGKVIAETYLSAGANVVVCDVNPDRLSGVQVEWEPTYAGRFLAQQTDVSSEAAVQSLVAATVAKFGRLDVLVNNAGIMDDFSPVGDCAPAQWERVLGVNITGPYLTSRAAVQQMETQSPPSGVIINIGSVASYLGFQAGVAYTVSKAGLMALTKNTAGFYGPRGISCVALLLGGMEGTNIAEAFGKGLHMEMYQQSVATHTKYEGEKHGLPLASVAKYCLFLSDPDIAPNANGSCVVFNRNWPEA